MWCRVALAITVAAAPAPAAAYRFDVSQKFGGEAAAIASAQRSGIAQNETVVKATRAVPKSESAPPALFQRHPIHEFDWARITGPQVAGCCVALFVFGILVSAAGIGGGGIYLATLMLIGDISPRDAVPLSHAIVTMGAFGSLFVNLRGAATSGSMDIDWDTCRMVVPASLLGSLFGFLMNAQVSDKLILKLLVVVLSVLIAVVLRIWWRQRCEEATAGPEAQQPRAAAANQGWPAEDAAGTAYQAPVVVFAVPGKQDKLESRPHGRMNRLELIISLLLLVVVDICSVLSFHMRECRAEQASHAHVMGACNHPVLLTFLGRRLQFGSDVSLTNTVGFTVQWLPILLCISISTFYAHFMYSQRKWSVAHVATIQGMGWSTGVIAGLAGIGGGLIYSPFFLISMDPLVAVSTSTTCLLFIAASSTFQYALTDRIIMSLGTTYGAVVLVASICGTVLIRMVRHRLPGGKSHITFVVVTAVVLTNCLIFGKLLMQMRTHVMG